MLLKTINYRGGIIRFQIPNDWVEEYEDVGGGTFYKPGDDTGTLRVNVMTGEGPPDKLVTVSGLAELLTSASTGRGAAPIGLGENAVMIRYYTAGEERGQPLMIRCWRILQALPPKNFRNVLFTYTVLADRFSSPASIEDMDLLDREIGAVQFAPKVGQLA
jgi:hypothetical protein